MRAVALADAPAYQRDTPIRDAMAELDIRESRGRIFSA
jgi:hypothetical protein